MESVQEHGIAVEELTQAFLACRKQLQRVVFNKIRCWESAQELAQECFLRAYKSRQTFHHQASIATWLTRIAINLAYDVQRSHKFRTISTEEDGIADAVSAIASKGRSPEDTTLLRQQIETLWSLVRKLPPCLKTIFELRYLNDLTEAEICRRTGLSLPSVKARLCRARVQLRELAIRKPLPSAKCMA